MRARPTTDTDISDAKGRLSVTNPPFGTRLGNTMCTAPGTARRAVGRPRAACAHQWNAVGGRWNGPPGASMPQEHLDTPPALSTSTELHSVHFHPSSAPTRTKPWSSYRASGSRSARRLSSVKWTATCPRNQVGRHRDVRVHVNQGKLPVHPLSTRRSFAPLCLSSRCCSHRVPWHKSSR